MTPTLQTRPHPHGDCMRASLAGILDLPIEQVPDFTALPGAHDLYEETGYPTWYLALQKWCAGKGYAFVEIQLSSKTWMPLPMETAAIFIGPHITGCRHAIVGKCEGEGFFPIFDPLGTDPTKAFVDGKIDAVCFLVPINPALQIVLGKAVDASVRLAIQLPHGAIKDAILANGEAALGLDKVIPMPEFNRPVIKPNGHGA